MLIDYIQFLFGLAFASAGGELFVRGTVGIARAARISPGIIAATVAAFATSSPELTVAVSSALEGSPEISLGDALGSNIVNVALILALAVLISPIVAARGSIRRDFPVAMTVPVILGILLLDGSLSRLDGLALLLGFAVWLIAIVREARKQRSEVGAVLGEPQPIRALAESAVGLVLLIAAGYLIVRGASAVAKQWGMSEFVIGALVVSIGTSMPELATAIISRLKGHDEIGLGTVLGSNIFNGLFIVGVASSITPITVGLRETAPAIVIGFAALVLTFPPRSGVISRWRGGLLLGLYAAYILTVLQWR